MIGRPHAALAPPRSIDVWSVDLAATGTRLVALECDRRLLTASETARACRIADAARRDDWIAAHAALHLALMDHLKRPVQLDGASGIGKPRVAGWSGDFSLSHSGRFALIAICEQGHVGIDAEVRRQVHLGPERRHLIEVAGRAALPDAPLPADDAEMRFLTAWTRLEAIAKMSATGIGALLEALGIVARSPGAEAVAERTRRLLTNDAQPTGIFDIDLTRFDAVAALAASPPAGLPRVRDLGADLDRLAG